MGMPSLTTSIQQGTSPSKLLELINEFSKFAKYKIKSKNKFSF
jgi:hypothetical protein